MFRPATFPPTQRTLSHIITDYIRQCVHNWPDVECIKILRAFIPALESCAPGTPLLINDTVLPRMGDKTRYEERLLRQLDVAMLVVINAKQRTEKEFRKLFKEADERFEVMHPFDPFP